jgi:hypothetical protein
MDGLLTRIQTRRTERRLALTFGMHTPPVRLVAVLGLMAGFGGVRAAAQSTFPDPGAKIRFSIAPSSQLHEGRLERMTGDSIVLERCPTCDRLHFGRAEIRDLEVWPSHASWGRALRGFGIGGAVGFAIAGLRGATCHGTADKCEDWVPLLGILGFAGGILGGFVGYLTGGSWQSP